MSHRHQQLAIIVGLDSVTVLLLFFILYPKNEQALASWFVLGNIVRPFEGKVGKYVL